MNRLLLKLFGVFQIGLIAFYQISYMAIQPTLAGIYIDIESYGVIFQGVAAVTNFIIITLIFGSAIFAVYSNYNKVILLMVLSLILDVLIIFFPFIFFSMNLDRIMPEFYITPVTFTIVIIILLFLWYLPSYKQQARIKKEILEIGTKYPSFRLKEVAKKCKVDKNSVVSVVKQMIKNNEIYADYFNISQKFVFNEEANLEEIDRLMELYNQWELEKIGKVA